MLQIEIFDSLNRHRLQRGDDLVAHRRGAPRILSAGASTSAMSRVRQPSSSTRATALSSCGLLAHVERVGQQHRHRQDLSQRIGHAEPRDVRSAASARPKQRYAIIQRGRGKHTERSGNLKPPHRTGCRRRCSPSRRRQRRWSTDQLHGGVVDEQVLKLHVGVLRRRDARSRATCGSSPARCAYQRSSPCRDVCAPPQMPGAQCAQSRTRDTPSRRPHADRPHPQRPRRSRMRAPKSHGML